MSKLSPFFFTGANAKIYVNGVTLAYATNISYSVVINHASPTVLGMYEASSIEPLSYSVSGQFTVIRYAADAKVANGGKRPHGTVDLGNGIGNWKTYTGFNPLKSIADGRAKDNMNPSKLDQAVMFDIGIYQGSNPVARIRNVRIIAANFNVAIDQVATQTFSFSAIYADEDSFIADFSGRGQQFE
jgi:hypothetical protein